MALRAVKPQAKEKRLKLFLFGPAGVGKTTAAIQFPRSYIIDCEKGAENYDKLITASNSVIFQSTDITEVIQEVKSLMTEKHDFRTLVIDPLTTIYNDLLEKSEKKVGSEFGRHYGEANKAMKRLVNLILALDMNVVVTAHAKKEYGQNLQVIGQTFDAWKQMDYLFDLVIELNRGAKDGKKIGKRPRMGVVVKTRLDAFPDGDTFDWSYDAIRDRLNATTLEREAAVVNMATPEQVEEVNALVSVVRLPDGTVEKWFAKAGVDTWDDMPADTLAKCIAFIKGRFPNTVAADAA